MTMILGTHKMRLQRNVSMTIEEMRLQSWEIKHRRAQ
jgi:hypothetical protein